MGGGLTKLLAGVKMIGLIALCLLPFTPNWWMDSREGRLRGRTVIRYCDSVSPGRQQATLELIAAFEKENPDVDVVVEFVPALNFIVTMLSRFAAGRAPDVLRISATNVGALATQGIFVDLRPYIRRDNVDLSAMYETVLKGFMFDGKLVGMPYYFGDLALAYNPDLFDAAGVPYPSDDWTWDNLRAAARRLTRDLDGDGRADQYGIEVTRNNLLTPLVFAESCFVASDRVTWRGDAPETLRAMQFAVDLIEKDKASPRPDECMELGYSHLGLFLAGKVAMCGIGSWDLKLLREAGIRWRLIEFPPRTRGGRRGSRWNGDAYSITAHCRNREAAWRLVKFMSSDKAQKLVATLGEGIPVRRSIAERYFITSGAPFRERAFIRAIGYAKFSDQFTEPELGAELDGQLELILLGNLSPREAMARFTPIATLLLSSQKVP